MDRSVLDRAIIGGVLVRPHAAPLHANIGIRAGKIAAICDPAVALDAVEVLDATGRHVFPGAIESHAHWGEGNGLADAATESTSAASGGVTTVLFFLRKNEPYGSLYHAWVEHGEAHSLVDFGFHAVLMTEAHLGEIDHYVEDLGITSYKCYFTYRGEDAAFMGIDTLDDGFLLDGFRRVARHPRALVIAHCENIELVHRARRALQAAGRDDMQAWQASRPILAEVDAVRRAMLFAEVSGCRLHILHLTSGEGLREVEAFRPRYPAVNVEVCHAYLALDGEGEVPRAAKLKPPLRPRDDVEALWRGVAGGTVQVVASDHVPRRLEVKSGSIWNPYTGAPGSALLLPLLLSEGYHKRGLPLSKIAELVALNPAMLYGLYPRKGALEVSSDADLAIVDLDREQVVRGADLHSHADYCLYEGWKLKGWPTHTMLRGEWVMYDRRIVGRPGRARYLAR